MSARLSRLRRNSVIADEADEAADRALAERLQHEEEQRSGVSASARPKLLPVEQDILDAEDTSPTVKSRRYVRRDDESDGDEDEEEEAEDELAGTQVRLVIACLG